MAQFNEKEFIVTNIINGIKKGTFAKEYGNIMAVKFVAKGFITFEEVAIIDAEITAWEESQNIEPPVVEGPIEGTTDEVIGDIPTEETTEIEDETILDGEDGTETEVEESQTETEILDDSTNEEVVKESVEEPEAEPTESTE